MRASFCTCFVRRFACLPAHSASECAKISKNERRLQDISQKMITFVAVKRTNDTNMANKDIVQKWLDHVHEDISAAEDLHKTGHQLYVAFLCHQAIEKVLKAYYIATHDDDPRYTHSHSKLLEDCGLTDEISPEHLRFIDFMVPMYIKARYPEQKVAAARSLTKEICEHIITTTKELTQWIEERLPEKKPSTPCDATNK